MSKTGSENRFRVIRDGTIEPKRQQDKTRAKMFQFMKMKEAHIYTTLKIYVY